MLLQEQQLIHDRFTLMFEQDLENIFDGVTWIVNEEILNIFLLPEDIEDIRCAYRGEFLRDNEYKKISEFYNFANMAWILELERCINFRDTTLFWDFTVHDIIMIFINSNVWDWKKNPKKFLRYFRIIEWEYEKQTGETLWFQDILM